MNTIKCITESSSTDIFLSEEFKIPLITEKKGLYVCDTNTIKLVEKYFFDITQQNNILILPAGEEHKNLTSICKILDKAQELGLARDSVFVGIGGGVITDMTAFACSIFMRGASLVLVPTTLLAMVDASIGGKTGIDYGSFKNSVGSFYPAKEIYIGANALDTLPSYEFFCGLGEVVKTAMLYDSSLFEMLEKEKHEILKQAQTKNSPKDYSKLLEIVTRCAKAKCEIVQQDLKESGMRMQLNLGHTFAHSLETFCGLGSLSHGEAVAWGLARAIRLGQKLNLTSLDYANRVINLLSSYGWCTEAIHPRAIEKAESLNLQKNKITKELTHIMQQDKKKRNGSVNFVLQDELCKTLIKEVPMETVETVLDE